MHKDCQAGTELVENFNWKIELQIFHFGSESLLVVQATLRKLMFPAFNVLHYRDKQ